MCSLCCMGAVSGVDGGDALHGICVRDLGSVVAWLCTCEQSAADAAAARACNAIQPSLCRRPSSPSLLGSPQTPHDTPT